MYTCDICGKQFNNPQKLGGHKSLHSRPVGRRKPAKLSNCVYCGKQFKVKKKNSKFCSKGCYSNYLKTSRLDSYVKIRHHNTNTTDVLDITVRELEQYRSKVRTCEICGNAETIKNGNINLATDHNHVTKKFRGLLCYACNVKLAWYEKEQENIESYLNKRGY